MKVVNQQTLAEHYSRVIHNLHLMNPTTEGTLGVSLGMEEIQTRNSSQNPGLKIMVTSLGELTAG